MRVPSDEAALCPALPHLPFPVTVYGSEGTRRFTNRRPPLPRPGGGTAATLRLLSSGKNAELLLCLHLNERLYLLQPPCLRGRGFSPLDLPPGRAETLLSELITLCLEEPNHPAVPAFRRLAAASEEDGVSLSLHTLSVILTPALAAHAPALALTLRGEGELCLSDRTRVFLAFARLYAALDEEDSTEVCLCTEEGQAFLTKDGLSLPLGPALRPVFAVPAPYVFRPFHRTAALLLALTAELCRR